jgi:hypothetical protein
MLREGIGKGVPLCTESASASVVRLRTGSRSCFARTLSERKRGSRKSIRGGKLPGENHQDFRFHLLPLEKGDARSCASGVATTGAAIRAVRGRFYFSIAGRWRFPSFINAGREISRLPQMPDGLISRISLD